MLDVIKESLECIIPLLLLRTPRVTHPKAHESPQEELRTGKYSFSLTSIHDGQSQKVSVEVRSSASQNTHRTRWRMQAASCRSSAGTRLLASSR